LPLDCRGNDQRIVPGKTILLAQSKGILVKLLRRVDGKQRAKDSCQIAFGIGNAHCRMRETAQSHVEEFLDYLIANDSVQCVQCFAYQLLRARPALAGALWSNEYTKTLVSRKNLPCIHFFPAEMPAGPDMAQAFHQVVEVSPVSRSPGILQEPPAERRV